MEYVANPDQCLKLVPPCSKEKISYTGKQVIRVNFLTEIKAFCVSFINNIL